jgi:hypothetical protein
VGNPNITLSPIDRLSSNKETSELIDIIDKMDLIGTTEYLATRYTFSAAHRILSKIGHILRDKASLKEYKKIDTSSYIFSDCILIVQRAYPVVYHTCIYYTLIALSFLPLPNF